MTTTSLNEMEEFEIPITVKYLVRAQAIETKLRLKAALSRQADDSSCTLMML